MSIRQNYVEPPLAILSKHFLVRYFDSEGESSSGELRTGIPALLGLTMAPGFFLCALLFEKYSTLAGWFRGVLTLDRDLTTLHDKYIFLTIAFAVSGIVTVLKWDNLFPDRRDYMILAPLPLHPVMIFGAKLIALAGFVVLFALAVNIIGSVFFPPVVLSHTGTFGLLIRYCLTHFICTLAASLAGSLLVITAAGAMLNLLPHALMRRVSSWLQFVLFVFFLTQLFLMSPIGDTVLTFREAEAWRSLLFPALWFVGLYETILARSEVDLSQWAGWAGLLLVSGLALSSLFYLLSYVRHFRRTAETSESAVAPGRLWRLLPAARDPGESAVVDFVKQTIGRCATHRLVLRIFLGVGCAVILQGLATRFLIGSVHENETGTLILAAPLVISFVLLAGLRFLLEVPIERRAAWVFRAAIDETASRQIARGVRRVMFEIGIAAWFAVTAPLNVLLLGFPLGLQHSLFCLLLSLVFLEGLLFRYRRVPFTSDLRSDNTNLGVALLFWVSLFAVYAYGSTAIEADLLARPILFTLLLMILLAAWRGLVEARKRWAPESGNIEFSDGTEAFVLTLDLQKR